MKATPVLPPELVDHILDKLATPPLSPLSQRTLTSCTLVCRTWLPRSSAYLLNNVTISSSRLEQYLAFAATSTRLATHAREFMICGTIDVTMYLDAIFSVMPNIDYLEIWNNSTTTFATPPTATSLLDHVDLTSNLDTDSRAAETGRFVLSHFKLLFVHLASVAGFLRPFRHVETLELEDVRGIFLDDSRVSYPLVKRRYAKRYPLSAPVICSLKNLILDGCCSSVVTGMLAYISLRPITITLRDLYPRDVRSLLEFLEDVGKNTEQLTLDLPVDPTGVFNAMWKSVLPEHGVHARGHVRGQICPNLQTVELSIIGLEEYQIYLLSMLWCLPSTMRRLRIRLSGQQLLQALDTIASAIGDSVGCYDNLHTLEFLGLSENEVPPPEDFRSECIARLPKSLSSMAQIVQ